MEKVLFVGRFQPFHHGHLQILKKHAESNKQFLIGIGSAQYHHTLKNPFSYAERKEMIQQSLALVDNLSFQIEPIPDINDPPHWVEHVEKTVSDFDAVLTNNTFTRSLFEAKGYTVYHTPMYNREKLKGSYIRQCIINEEPWSHLVPSTVFEYITQIDGCTRLRQLVNDH